MNTPGSILLATALWVLPQLALAQSPSPTDFAFGMTLTPSTGKPLQQMDIPGPVYAQVTRANLNDIRVFNAAGVAVPHAICPAAESVNTDTREVALPIFVLRAPRTDEASDARKIAIQTAQGTRVQVIEPLSDAILSGPDADEQALAYVVDLQALKTPVNAINIDWNTAASASEVHLRILQSNDLQTWHTISNRQTLVKAQGDSGVLVRKRIPLPKKQYVYLRLERAADSPAIQITSVNAELPHPAPLQTKTSVSTELTSSKKASDDRVKTYTYDSAHRAPAQAATLQLPQENMALQIALASRSGENGRWQKRWQGDVTSIANSKVSQINFPSTTDRYWRVQVLQGGDSLTGDPALSLAYIPQRLRFLAQGEPPYTLAFGSANVNAAARGCNQLLSGESKEKLATLTGVAAASDLRILGDASVLEPTPKATSVWTYIFWVVLAIATLLLLAMAISLLKTIRAND